MSSIAENLIQIRQRIRAASESTDRIVPVKLVAVSKTRTTAEIISAVTSGQLAFGENYLQEALSKIKALTDSNLEWHFIGAIQSNKTRAIAENFHWVQSVARLDIAKRLSQQRPATMPTLNLLIQVNISAEAQKAGVSAQELSNLAHAVAKLPRIKLRGLMAIPVKSNDPQQQRRAYDHMHQLFEQLCAEGLVLDTLSMGMSSDFTLAIEEGSTLVRLGTAIFGPRYR